MFLRRISIRFVDIVAGLATTSDGMVVVVDSMKPTIFILNPDNGKQLGFLECADFMIEPSDIAIYKDDFYICDFKVCSYPSRPSPLKETVFPTLYPKVQRSYQIKATLTS